MRNLLIQGCLQNFRDQYALRALSEATLFELMINMCVICRLTTSQFDFFEINVGGDGEVGIDGIAILINDIVITDIEDAKEILSKSKAIEVKYIFIQSKTSDKIELGDVLKFLTAVKLFFSERNGFDRSEKINYYKTISDMILLNASKINKNPECEMYYVYTGNLDSDSNINAARDETINSLKATNYFSNIKFDLWNSKKILSIYKEINNKIERDVLFEKNYPLAPIKNVNQAYIGVMTCNEYMKLITDEDGNLYKSLFYDNVRDFQGMNPVNKEIASTLIEVENQDRFAILNNGITIVAKRVNQVGPKFKLVDYQIVNGCQTSHVLYIHKNKVNDETYLPIKLIVTEDPEVTNQIIKATNRQTNINVEAFEALKSFHKNLEQLYETLRSAHKRKLYYERRSKQYDNSEVKRHQIVTIPLQINTVISMFYNEPHSTHRYYAELLKAYKDRIFKEDHDLLPYYASAYALNSVDSMLSNNTVDYDYRFMRYHLIMVFRILINGHDIPPFNARAMKGYCDRLIKVLDDDTICQPCFVKAMDIIKNVLRKFEPSSELNRLKVITAQIVGESTRLY